MKIYEVFEVVCLKKTDLQYNISCFESEENYPLTKSKAVFPNDDALMKMLYLATIDITEKWTGRRKDWGQIRSQLDIFFADRLPQ